MISGGAGTGERRIAEARQIAKVDLLAEAQAAYPGNHSKHVFEVQMPDALARSSEVLETSTASRFIDDYWFALYKRLQAPKQGVFYIFIDENQELYCKHTSLPDTARLVI